MTVERVALELEVAKSNLANCRNTHANSAHMRPCQHCAEIEQYITYLAGLKYGPVEIEELALTAVA